MKASIVLFIGIMFSVQVQAQERGFQSIKDGELSLVYEALVLPEVVNNIVSSFSANPPKDYTIKQENHYYLIYKNGILEITFSNTPYVAKEINHQTVGMCRVRSRRPEQPDIFGYTVKFEDWGKNIRHNPDIHKK